MNSLYLIGAPASGKTTLLHSLLGHVPQQAVIVPGSTKHVRYWPEKEGFTGIQLGVPREGGFGGTDSLPFNAITALEDWLGSEPPDWLVAEGDRLSNDRFFTFLASLGHLDVVEAYCAPEVLVERLVKRGSKQDHTWLRGRQTKVRRLAEHWNPIRINTGLNTNFGSPLLGHPVIANLRNGSNLMVRS